MNWNETTDFQDKRTFCASDSSNKKGSVHPLLAALHNLPFAGGAVVQELVCVLIVIQKCLLASGRKATVRQDRDKPGQCCPWVCAELLEAFGAVWSQLAEIAELAQP